MKKLFLTLFFVFLSFFCLSCNTKHLPELIGKWEGEVTLKSDLAGSNPEDSIVAHLYTHQKITISFSEGNVFTKSVEQSVDYVDFVDSNQNLEEAKAYFSQFFNKNLVFDGEYIQKSSFITFTTLFVSENGGDVLSYADFYALDSSIGDSEYSAPYVVKEDELFIDGISYRKVL